MLGLVAPKDTLAYQLSRPLMVPRSMASTSCASIGPVIKDFQQKVGAPNTSPEQSAVQFYTMNHGVAIVRSRRAALEPLPVDDLSLVTAHLNRNTELAFRMFSYLYLICTREARHVQASGSFEAKLVGTFGKEVADFVNSVPDSASQAQQIMFAKPPKYAIGAHAKALQFTFYNGGFSGGFGGKKWGQIADCLSSYVWGEISAEIMLDTAFTLSHNNGPIFNKGMLFGGYGSDLIRILDVQRSGQMPQAVLHDPAIKEHVNAETELFVKRLLKIAPELNKPVDWFMVEALGSVHKYGNEKKAQLAAGHSSEFSVDLVAKEVEASEKAAKAAALKAQQQKLHYFEVMPGMNLKKVQVQRAA